MKRTTVIDLFATMVFLALVALVFNVTTSFASEASGRSAILSNITGEVTVRVDGTEDWVPVTEDTVLMSGDSIHAGNSSTATLTFFDGSQTMIFPNTALRISEMSGSAEGGSKVILIKQWWGRTFNRVERLLDMESRFEIETPNALTVVRGTGFGVFHEDGNTQVDVLEGTVEVTGQEQTVKVEVDQTTSVPEGEDPMPVAPREDDGDPYQEVNKYLENNKPKKRGGRGGEVVASYPSQDGDNENKDDTNKKAEKQELKQEKKAEKQQLRQAAKAEKQKLRQEQKEEKQKLKEEQKEEKQKLKEEKKEEKQKQKKEKKEEKQKQKKEKKEEKQKQKKEKQQSD